MELNSISVDVYNDHIYVKISKTKNDQIILIK